MVLGHPTSQLQERYARPAEKDLVVQFHDPADRSDQIVVAWSQPQASGNAQAIPEAEERDPHRITRPAAIFVKLKIEGERGRDRCGRGGRARRDHGRLALDPAAWIEGKDIAAKGAQEDLVEVARVMEGARARAYPEARASTRLDVRVGRERHRWLLRERDQG